MATVTPDDREWRILQAAHVEAVLTGAVLVSPLSLIRPGPDQGGLTVEICGLDGEWRRYFVRLTEVPE